MTDADKTEFIVQPELLPELARRCGLTSGLLSMIASEPPGSTSSEEAVRMLLAEGLIDDQGQVPERYCRELAILANPHSRLRIFVIQDSAVLDYSSLDGGVESRLSVTVTDRGLVIRDPPDDASIIHWLSGIIGESTFIQTPVAVTLPAEEALVLAAIIDLQRKELLMALIEAREGLAVRIEPPDILKELQAGTDQTSMFVPLIRGVTDRVDPLSADETGSLLSRLSARGILISPGPGLYSLSPGYFPLARQLKVFSTILRVSYAIVDNGGGVRISGFTAVQGGLTEIVVIERDTDSCTIRTVPSQELSQLTKILMEHPRWPEEEADTHGQESELITCPHCNARLPSSAKFCRRCGNPVMRETS
jgi:ribosomal protein L40E